MITAPQFNALGPLAREIIVHDRQTADDRNYVAERKVIALDERALSSMSAAAREACGEGATVRQLAAHFKGRREERSRLTAGMAALCNRPAAPGNGPPLAAAGARR